MKHRANKRTPKGNNETNKQHKTITSKAMQTNETRRKTNQSKATQSKYIKSTPRDGNKSKGKK